MPLTSSGIIQRPLFVYGTLRSKEANFDAYLDGCVTRTLTATIPGRLYLYEPGGFPYLVAGPGEVSGEILHIRPECWDQVIVAIDRLEDYRSADENGSWYLRKLVQAHQEDGASIECWTYYWNRSELGRLIASGDWKLKTED